MGNAHNSALVQSAAEIAANLANLETELRRAALEAFRVLEQFDRETASLAMAVFDDRDDAALWFARILPFSDIVPWNLIAAGEVEKVRAILNTIPEGGHYFD